MMDFLKLKIHDLTYLAISLLCLITKAGSLECYQCDSSKQYCPEFFRERYHEMPHDSVTSLVPKSCDYIFEARYCVKTTGMFEGELGTKRFCSARDWGDFCEWIKRPGDEREYRACIFTCSGDSCNTGQPMVTPSWILLPIAVGVSIIVDRALKRWF